MTFFVLLTELWRVGRPGMDVWRIVVIGIFKQGIDCEFDRLAELAKKHKDLRALLCRGVDEIDGGRTYTARGLMRNIRLLMPDLL